MVIIVLGVFIIVLSHCFNTSHSRIKALIDSSVICAALGVLIAELTSLFTAYNLLWVSLCWFTAFAGVCFIHLRRCKSIKPLVGFFQKPAGLSRWEIVTLMLMLGTVCCALVNIVISPPNTPVDSLIYHQTRAFMFYKNQSIHNFAAPSGHMLYFGPLNALWMSQLQILCFGWDGLYKVVQFAAYLLSMLTVYQITLTLCRERKYALIAGALVCFMPMAYLQSFTTQSDLLVSALCLAAIHYMMRLYSDLSGKKAVSCYGYVMLGLTCGLAVLSKLNAGVVLIGFSLLLAGYLFVKLRWKAFSKLLIILLCALLITGGHWTRNALDWHGDFLPVSYAGSRPYYQAIGVKGVALIAVKAIAVTFATPSLQKADLLSKPSLAMVNAAASLLGMDVNAPGTNEGEYVFTGQTGYSPDCVSYPLHAFLVLAALVFCFVYACRKKDWLILAYTLCCLLGIAVTSTQYQWVNSYNRYLMPPVLTALPLGAFMLRELSQRRVGKSAAAIFMCLAFAFNGICIFTCLRGEINYYRETDMRYDERVLRSYDPSVLTMWREVTEDVRRNGYTKLALINDAVQGDYIWMRPYAAPGYEVRCIDTAYRSDLEDPQYQPDFIIATRQKGKVNDTVVYHGNTYLKKNESLSVYKGLNDCQFVYYTLTN